MIKRGELQDAAAKAFGAGGLSAPRDEGWTRVTELGWVAAVLPEDAGGLGLGGEAMAALSLELGKVLASVPLTPALATAHVVAGAQADRADRFIEGGYVAASLAFDRVTGDAAGLSGRLRAVPDADMADDLLVFAGGLAALVPADGDGVTLREVAHWDESRRFFEVVLDGHAVSTDRVLAEGQAAERMASIFEGLVQIALAADSLGGAIAALDLTIEYLKTRRQFDRPLGMFQALKHRCADLATAIAAAEALLWSRTGKGDGQAGEIAAAKAHACDVYRIVTEEAVQLHGGIGLTEEYPIHLFQKRAMLNLSLGREGDDIMEGLGRSALSAGADESRRQGL